MQVGERLGVLSVFVPERGMEAAFEAELVEHDVTPDLRAGSFLGAALQILGYG